MIQNEPNLAKNGLGAGEVRKCFKIGRISPKMALVPTSRQAFTKPYTEETLQAKRFLEQVVSWRLALAHNIA